MRSYRVLVVTNLWPYAADPGWGSFVQAQMESMRPLGVDFDVLYIDGRASRWNYFRAVAKLRRRMRARHYDFVHAHFGLSGLVARCQMKAPVVMSFMGHDVLGQPRGDGGITLTGRFYQISSFLLARVVSAVIVKTQEMKRKLRLESAHVIPNGVDLNVFRPIAAAEARHVLGLDAARKFALFPYSPAEVGKRFDLIQAAVAKARAEVPELEILQVCGVPRSRVAMYMNAADVFVLASWIEGSPNVVKEAMAVNLPVVAVDVGDVVDLIGPTAGCYIVARDADAIAAKIVEVCRRGTRTQGREWIARLSVDKVAKQIVDVYAQALRS